MKRTVVVKLGGKALVYVPVVAEMARKARVCVVHGGGAQINAIALICAPPPCTRQTRPLRAISATTGT